VEDGVELDLEMAEESEHRMECKIRDWFRENLDGEGTGAEREILQINPGIESE
jgi:hypothetical protein